jgi:hypothetical protein
LTFYLPWVPQEVAKKKIKEIYKKSMSVEEPESYLFRYRLLEKTISLVGTFPFLQNTLVEECNKILKTDQQTESEQLLADLVYSPNNSPDKLQAAVKILPDQEEFLVKT